MQDLEGLVRCTICGQPRTGVNTIHGAEVCDTCKKDGPDFGMQAIQKLGKLEWTRKGNFFKPLWIEAQGWLPAGRSSGLEAVLSGKKPPRTQMRTGHPEFDDSVRIETRTEDALGRFLADEGVRGAIAHIAKYNGRIVLNDDGMELEMHGAQLQGGLRVTALYTESLWAVGILFSRFAGFAGVDWPELTLKEANPFVAIRASERPAWLRRHAERWAEVLGGEAQGEDYDQALEIDGCVQGRAVHVDLDTDEGTIEGSMATRSVPFEVAFANDSLGNLLGSLKMVDLGESVWAYAYHPHGPAEARATLDAMGSERVESIAKLVRRRQVLTLGLGGDKLSFELQRAAPHVPPEELYALFEDLVALVSTLEPG